MNRFIATMLICLVGVQVHADTVESYRSSFDQLLVANDSSFSAMATTSDEQTREYSGYIIDGVTGMYQATGNNAYLLKTLTWAESLMAKATIRDNDGFLNWNGAYSTPRSSVSIQMQQYDLQVGRALARVARLIHDNPTLVPTYGARAQQLHDFVATNVINKWYTRGGGPNYAYLDGSKATYPNFGDKGAFWGNMLSDLIAVTPNSTYSIELTHIVNGFNQRLIAGGVSGALRMLDNGNGDSCGTSHFNHSIHFAARMYEDGRGISLATLKGLALQLASVIWDGSTSIPKFTNDVAGTQNACWDTTGYPAYDVGQVYQGWVRLGMVDSRALLAARSMLDAVLAGQTYSTNPSVRYNKDILGHIELLGHVTRALTQGTTPVPTTDSVAPTVTITSPVNGSVVQR
jgi:hypothetical protein